MSRHAFCAVSLGSIVIVERKRTFDRNGSFNHAALRTSRDNESAAMTVLRGKLKCLGQIVEGTGHAWWGPDLTQVRTQAGQDCFPYVVSTTE